MNKKIMTVLITFLMMIGMCVPVFADDVDTAGNIFEADDNVKIESGKYFSAFAAGQNVLIDDSECEGSVYEAGQEVSITYSVVGESLFIAGNNVTCKDTYVHGNIFAAGNNVVIGNGAEGNGVYIAGSTVNFDGEAKALCAAGGTVIISGNVDGDAYIEGQKVIVTDEAKITGDLKIASANKPEVSEKASIGDYEYEEVSEEDDGVSGVVGKPSIGTVIWGKIKSCAFWIVAMGAFGVLLCWLFNPHLEKAAELIRTRPGVMIGTGVTTWVCVPIAALILCISCVLAPVAGLLMMAYVLLLCAGLAFTGASLGRLFMPRMNIYLSSIIAIAILEIIRMIPVLGFLVGCVADMYLLAYVVLRIWSLRKNNEEVADV